MSLSYKNKLLALKTHILRGII